MTTYNPSVHRTVVAANGESSRKFHSINKLLIDMDAAGMIKIAAQDLAPGDTTVVWLDLTIPEDGNGQAKVYDGGSWVPLTPEYFVTALVDDTSPKLGGNLDLNGFDITGTGNISITGNLDLEAVRAGNGSAGAPGIAFASDTDTGMFLPASNTLAFATGGVERFRIPSYGGIQGLSSIQVGSSSALSEGKFAILTGSLTRTASGSTSAVDVTPVIAPASNSSAEFRVLNIQATPDMDGVNLGTLRAAYASVRPIRAGTLFSLTGIYATGLLIGSTVVSLGTVTNATGAEFQAVNSFDNAIAATITNAIGVRVSKPTNSGSGPLSITKAAGIAIDGQTEGADNTDLLIGTLSIPTGNFAVYSASSKLSQFGGPIGVKSYTVATVPAASAGGGQVIYVSNETGGAVLAFSDGTDWRRVTDRNVISA